MGSTRAQLWHSWGQAGLCHPCQLHGARLVIGGTRPVFPQAASTGLGSRKGKAGPDRHNPAERRDMDRGRASGSVPLQGKDKETAPKPGTFICSRANRTQLGPSGHSARAGGITERGRENRGTVHHPCPAAWGKEQHTAPLNRAPAPFSVLTQGEAGETQPALPNHPTAPHQAHRMLHPM